jgi:hypothetical protein
MKTIKNAPFYLIIVAVVKEQIQNCGTTFKIGEEWMVDQSQMRTAGYDKPDEMYVGKRSPISFMGFNIFKVPVDKFELKVKTIVPKFKVGDVVIHIKANNQTIAQRISSYNLSNGTIWYQDEWGDSQGLASGYLEEDIRLANEDECKRSGWALERTYSKV